MRLYLLIFFLLSKSYLFASWDLCGLDSQKVWDINIDGSKMYYNNYTGIYLSNDYGNEWDTISKFEENDTIIPFITSFETQDNFIVAGIDGFWGAVTIISSKDHGKSWRQFNTDLEFGFANSVEINNNEIIFGSNQGIFTSIDSGDSWQYWESTKFYCIICIEVSNDSIFLGTDQGIYLLNKQDSSAQLFESGFKYLDIYCMKKIENIFLVGTNAGFFFSRDNGQSWEKSLSMGGAPSDALCIDIVDDKVIVGTMKENCGDR